MSLPSRLIANEIPFGSSSSCCASTPSFISISPSAEPKDEVKNEEEEEEKEEDEGLKDDKDETERGKEPVARARAGCVKRA